MVDVAALVADLDDPVRRRRALARLLTVVDGTDVTAIRQVVGALHPRSGRARVMGVTGAPGVGKSTLTNALARELRARGRSVAVVAVDPSSPFSGGALLGDRVRMSDHTGDEGVFIRSMASRGHLGGLGFATPQAVLVLDAAGFDDVVVETVGVGQSEVEVARTADTVVVASAPGMGDGVQAAKAGIMEVADVLAVTKADLAGAGRLLAELRGAADLGGSLSGDGWRVPVVRTAAPTREGVEALVDAVDEHGRWLSDSGAGGRRRRDRVRHLVRELALAQVRSVTHDRGQRVEALVDRVLTRDLDPWSAADALLVDPDA